MKYLLFLLIFLLLGCTTSSLQPEIKSDTIGQYRTNEAVVFCSITRFNWANFRDYVLTRFPEAEFANLVKIEGIQYVIVVRNIKGDALQFFPTVPTVIQVTPVYLRDSKGNKIPPKSLDNPH